jgi:hypothetical protein
VAIADRLSSRRTEDVAWNARRGAAHRARYPPYYISDLLTRISAVLTRERAEAEPRVEDSYRVLPGSPTGDVSHFDDATSITNSLRSPVSACGLCETLVSTAASAVRSCGRPGLGAKRRAARVSPKHVGRARGHGRIPSIDL